MQVANGDFACSNFADRIWNVRFSTNIQSLNVNVKLQLLFAILLSVQWTEYKFNCMYRCVCVSVTLSVNSPTGQTPQRIMTVDSLIKRRGFTQGCAFWGSR